MCPLVIGDHFHNLSIVVSVVRIRRRPLRGRFQIDRSIEARTGNPVLRAGPTTGVRTYIHFRFRIPPLQMFGSTYTHVIKITQNKNA